MFSTVSEQVDPIIINLACEKEVTFDQSLQSSLEFAILGPKGNYRERWELKAPEKFTKTEIHVWTEVSMKGQQAEVFELKFQN